MGNGRIEGLIFDFGGVLLVQSPAEYAEWDKKYGMPQHTLWKALYRGPEWEAMQTGRGDEARYQAYVLQRLEEAGCSDPLECLGSFQAFQQEVRLHEPVVELIRALRGRYRLGLLSNATVTLDDRLRDLGLHEEFFDDIVNSARVGMAKPDPAVYRLAARRLGLEPPQCFFTDDYIKNVLAAQEVGMAAHHFQGYEGLAACLEDLGVLP